MCMYIYEATHTHSHTHTHIHTHTQTHTRIHSYKHTHTPTHTHTHTHQFYIYTYMTFSHFRFLLTQTFPDLFFWVVKSDMCKYFVSMSSRTETVVVCVFCLWTHCRCRHAAVVSCCQKASHIGFFEEYGTFHGFLEYKRNVDLRRVAVVLRCRAFSLCLSVSLPPALPVSLSLYLSLSPCPSRSLPSSLPPSLSLSLPPSLHS